LLLLNLPLFPTHAKLAQRLLNTTNQEFFMKKYLCVLIALSQVSTGLAMLSAKQEFTDGKTPLICAAMNHASLTELIKANPTLINYQDCQGRTALHYAAANGDKTNVEFLIKNGADKSLKDKQDKTAEDLYKRLCSYESYASLTR
jgi:uncharacterized protein YxeA